jgi:hypothetical protein
MFDKLGKQFGAQPPSWATGGDLGRADSDPAGICSGLGLGSFQGAGDDWLVDIVRMLSIAVRSNVLYGLYSPPTPKGDRTGLALNVSADLISFDSGAVSMRMIKSTLWAAEQAGKIAMPNRLRVKISSDKRTVIVQVE